MSDSSSTHGGTTINKVESLPLPVKRTIYFVWPYSSWGGAQIYLLAIMKIARPKWKILVILPQNSSTEILGFLDDLSVKYEFIKTSTDELPAHGLTAKLNRQIRRIRSEIEIYRHLLKYNLKDHILHIDIGPWQSWIFLTALAARRANIFITLHNFLSKAPLWRESVWKMRLQFVSRLPSFHIFASNQDTKDRMKDWVSSKFRDRVKVTYTSVDPEQIQAVLDTDIDQQELRINFGISPDKFIVLCVGQFIDRKGRWVFLDAAREVAAKTQEIEFVWLTPKMPSGEEFARIETYDLKNCFHLIHSPSVGKTRVDVLRFFLIADVFTLPSFVEGLPIALLEAMALGLPSISTNVYAIPEALKNNETGLLIEPGNSIALANAIFKLHSDAVLRNSLAQNGQQFVMNNFDEREAARIVLSEYEACF